MSANGTRRVRIVPVSDYQLRAEVQSMDGCCLASFTDVTKAQVYCAMMGYRVVP